MRSSLVCLLAILIGIGPIGCDKPQAMEKTQTFDKAIDGDSPLPIISPDEALLTGKVVSPVESPAGEMPPAQPWPPADDAEPTSPVR
ncbi:MAG: hypothetical protein HQ546_06060 [Planctomycetes bacterium]|nr:hypothetical protein [Planctomycetota bacterium]